MKEEKKIEESEKGHGGGEDEVWIEDEKILSKEQSKCLRI